MSKLVLLIEDDVDDERLTLRTLRKNNIDNEVVVACDGQEAIDFLFKKGSFTGSDAGLPALILLDLKLPKLSGLEVLRKIREREETRHIPVVVLTASSDPSQIDEAYLAGANSFVRKPDDTAGYSEAILSISLYWLMLNENSRNGP
jgi:two-component system, response regulator